MGDQVALVTTSKKSPPLDRGRDSSMQEKETLQIILVVAAANTGVIF